MPFSAKHTHDFYYRDITTPAGWVRDHAERLGMHIKVVEDLDYAGYCTPDGGTIVTRPGLAFPDFHWLVACGAIAKQFGFDVTPDLAIGGPPALASGGAQIIQFRPRGARRR